MSNEDVGLEEIVGDEAAGNIRQALIDNIREDMGVGVILITLAMEPAAEGKSWVRGFAVTSSMNWRAVSQVLRRLVSEDPVQ